MRYILLLCIVCLITFFLAVSFIDVDIYSEPQWSIGLFQTDSTFAIQEIVNNPIFSREDVKGKATKFVADPFVFEDDGVYYLFYEQGNIRNGKWISEIAYAESNDGKTYKNKGIVFKDRVSISFPIVYSVDKDFYMTMEGAEANNIRLLKADRFPDKWSVVDTLLTGRYSDPVLHNQAGSWFLFVSTDSNRKARLFCSESINGPFKEHTSSPIVQNDKRISRNAGSIFQINNCLYRPVQDCSNMYGEKVRLLEILDLTKDSYSEKEISKSPILYGSGSGWNKLKMHSFNLFKLNDRTHCIITDGSPTNYVRSIRLHLKKMNLTSKLITRSLV